MNFCWFTSFIGYPNFFKESGRGHDLAEAFLVLARASLEGRPYSAAKKLFPRLDAHQVETKKAAFQEFGLLYVIPRSDSMTLTPLGHRIYQLCAYIPPKQRDRREILYNLVKGLSRYQFNNPLPVGGRAGAPRASSSNVLPYLTTYYLMARLDGVLTASELRGALFELQDMSDLRQMEQRIKLQRGTGKMFTTLSSLPSRMGTAENLRIYFVSHLSLDNEIMTTTSGRLFYGRPEQNLVLSQDGSELIKNVLSQEWKDWQSGSSIVPKAKSYPTPTDYFTRGIGQRSAVEIAVSSGPPARGLVIRPQPIRQGSSSTLTAVEAKNDVEKLQSALERFIAQQATMSVECIIGYPGGSGPANVLYWSKQDIWVFSKKLENRYWNVFGIGKPIRGRNHSIVCEINIPFSGNDRHIQGSFAVSGDGRIFLVHRGRIGGGTKGIGKTLLMENYRGKLAELTDVRGDATVVPVGRLGDAEFPLQVATFVREIARLKRLIKEKRSFRLRRKSRGFRKEFTGRRGYKITRDVSADVNHGAVVNELAHLLKLKKLDVDNDRRDLFIRNKRDRITTLFEAKTSFDSFSIYSAIGQLYYYSLDERLRPRLVAVLPEGTSTVIMRRLKRLGIETLRYRLRPNKVTFLQLPDYGQGAGRTPNSK